MFFHYSLLLFLSLQASGNSSLPLAGEPSRVGPPDGLEAIATIDGEIITVREFQQEMNYRKARVFSHFNRRYPQDSIHDFWHHPFDGKTPLEVLKEKALDAACRVKIQQILIKEKGLESDISYQTFVRRWKEENKARKNAVEHGEVIYGPVQYTERNYFQYLLTNQVIRLKEIMAGHELPFTNADMKRHFEEIKRIRYGRNAGRFEDHHNDVRTNYLEALFDDYIEKRLAESNIQINEEVYKHYENDPE